MSQISLKSITGITSITTPAGVDNQLTVHTNDTAERIKITSSGLNVSGVVTATSFSGSGANLTGLDKQVTIGMRVGAAVTFSATGSSFNVVGRSGNIPISY